MTITAPSQPATVAEGEVGLTLADPPPRSLGTWDITSLWGNLGVSLLGFTGALFVLVPVATPLPLAAAFLAVVVGTVLGILGVAAVGVAGTRTGAPAMVLLRGLFGTRPSYLPTVLNIVQLLGWGTFELVTIGTALHQVAPHVARWIFVLSAGVLTTVLALRPLGWIRVLRRYVTVAVMAALVYLLIQLLRHPLPSLTHGSWTGFWLAVDTVIGVSVSWVPVVADYSRHARSTRAAFGATILGYSVTQVACYVVGLITLATVAHGDGNRIFGAFMAIPLGTLAFAVLAGRELDQSFVDTYSTAVSVQNLRPRADRRLLVLGLGTLSTVAALALNIGDYGNFLTLVGSVFVPMLGVIVIDYFVVSRASWDLGESTPARVIPLLAWVLGFCAYQLVNPGSIGWWARMWAHPQSWVGLSPAPVWLSASLFSFVVAAVATLPGVLVGGRSARRKEPVC